MDNTNSDLVNTILKKGGLAKDVTDSTFNVLTLFKTVLQQIEVELKSAIIAEETRIKIQYKDRGSFEAEIKVAEDVLIFVMHTNAFVFNSAHAENFVSY